MSTIARSIAIFLSTLILHEVFAYLVIDKEWAFIVLFGEFKMLYFGGYILLTLALPFLLIFREGKPYLTVIASLFTIIGGYIGRYIFVYGGNANPMSNRFGTGYEKYDLYDVQSSFNYAHPHLGEILIVVGSVGVCILVYKLFDGLFSVGKLREYY